jgi:hypothetical protein
LGEVELQARTGTAEREPGRGMRQADGTI